MNHHANSQSVDLQTFVEALFYQEVNLKLEEATEDDLNEKESLKKWRKEMEEKEGGQKRETDTEEPEPKRGPKS